MATIDISTNEILDALRAAKGQQFKSSDCYTSNEYAEAMGISPEHVTRIFRKLKAAGQIHCEVVIRESLDGRMVRVPAYRFIAPKKAKR